MRLTRIVPLLPLASALVITDTDVFQNVEKSGRSIIDNAQSVLDDAIGKAHQTYDKMKDEAKSMYSKVHDVSYDISAWLEGSSFDDGDFDFEADHEHCDHPPHGGPPHHGPPPHHGSPPRHGPPPPHHGKPPHGKPPHHRPPPHGPPHHGKPHHPPHDEKPNRTVYELISESNYTTKLAKLINEYDELVKLLNGTEANYTVFAPTDKAFENIPDHGKKPSKEALKSILLYHVSDDFYPAGRVLHSYTIPTLYEPEKLLGHKQRLTVRITLRGPTINFYSKLVATNIFATNGVIHGVDSILIPPPSVASIIDLLPSEFSTLELGLSKTGLWDKLNGTKYAHEGGTFFTPSNTAFKKLGPRINAFLFSSYGQKYLKALLEYHIVVNQTLYTDAFYDATSDGNGGDGDDIAYGDDCDEGGDEDEADRPPYFHYDLPTVLNGKYLAVDVTRYGPFVSIRINKFSRVTVHDGIASDGVIQVVSNVLIPPRNAKSGEEVFWEGEEMSVEELKERLEPYVVDENMEL